VRRQAPSSCPVCQASLRIARLECDACKTAIEGDFDHGRLGRLSREQLAFVEVFLECRGKIKDVEQRLGLSYPTVVSRLDQVVDAMTELSSADRAADGGERQAWANEARTRKIDAVLEALARGELSPRDAAERLKPLRSRDKPRS
jgi:hypothetical protein